MASNQPIPGLLQDDSESDTPFSPHEKMPADLKPRKTSQDKQARHSARMPTISDGGKSGQVIPSAETAAYVSANATKYATGKVTLRYAGIAFVLFIAGVCLAVTTADKNFGVKYERFRMTGKHLLKELLANHAPDFTNDIIAPAIAENQSDLVPPPPGTPMPTGFPGGAPAWGAVITNFWNNYWLHPLVLGTVGPTLTPPKPLASEAELQATLGALQTAAVSTDPVVSATAQAQMNGLGAKAAFARIAAEGDAKAAILAKGMMKHLQIYFKNFVEPRFADEMRPNKGTGGEFGPRIAAVDGRTSVTRYGQEQVTDLDTMLRLQEWKRRLPGGIALTLADEIGRAFGTIGCLGGLVWFMWFALGRALGARGTKGSMHFWGSCVTGLVLYIVIRIWENTLVQSKQAYFSSPKFVDEWNMNAFREVDLWRQDEPDYLYDSPWYTQWVMSQEGLFGFLHVLEKLIVLLPAFVYFPLVAFRHRSLASGFVSSFCVFALAVFTLICACLGAVSVHPSVDVLRSTPVLCAVVAGLWLLFVLFSAPVSPKNSGSHVVGSVAHAVAVAAVLFVAPVYAVRAFNITDSVIGNILIHIFTVGFCGRAVAYYCARDAVNTRTPGPENEQVDHSGKYVGLAVQGALLLLETMLVGFELLFAVEGAEDQLGAAELWLGFVIYMVYQLYRDTFLNSHATALRKSEFAQTLRANLFPWTVDENTTLVEDRVQRMVGEEDEDQDTGCAAAVEQAALKAMAIRNQRVSIVQNSFIVGICASVALLSYAVGDFLYHQNVLPEILDSDAVVRGLADYENKVSRMIYGNWPLLNAQLAPAGANIPFPTALLPQIDAVGGELDQFNAEKSAFRGYQENWNQRAVVEEKSTQEARIVFAIIFLAVQLLFATGLLTWSMNALRTSVRALLELTIGRGQPAPAGESPESWVKKTVEVQRSAENEHITRSGFFFACMACYFLSVLTWEILYNVKLDVMPDLTLRCYAPSGTPFNYENPVYVADATLCP